MLILMILGFILFSFIFKEFIFFMIYGGKNIIKNEILFAKNKLYVNKHLKSIGKKIILTDDFFITKLSDSFFFPYYKSKYPDTNSDGGVVLRFSKAYKQLEKKFAENI